MRVLATLALVPLVSAALRGPEARAPHGQTQPDPADRVDDRLQLLNNTFHQRLETTYKHLQAVMPGGYTSVERYLQLGNKKYLLEYALDNRKANQQMREDYSLRFLNHDTVRVGKAHYVAAGKSTTKSVQSSLAYASEYLNDSYFEATNLLLTQTFDPLAVFALRPGATRSRQWLYAQAQGGDTVASYHLLRSRTGDTCQVQLRERMKRQQPWRHSNRLVCSWVVEVARRRLTAEQVSPGEGGGILRWVRTYRTATDFTETLTGQYSIGDGGPPHTVASVCYSRDFTQINPSRSVDTFTVFDGPTNFNEPSDFASPSVTKAILTFNVISAYH